MSEYYSPPQNGGEESDEDKDKQSGRDKKNSPLIPRQLVPHPLMPPTRRPEMGAGIMAEALARRQQQEVVDKTDEDDDDAESDTSKKKRTAQSPLTLPTAQDRPPLAGALVSEVVVTDTKPTERQLEGTTDDEEDRVDSTELPAGDSFAATLDDNRNRRDGLDYEDLLPRLATDRVSTETSVDDRRVVMDDALVVQRGEAVSPNENNVLEIGTDVPPELPPPLELDGQLIVGNNNLDAEPQSIDTEISDVFIKNAYENAVDDTTEDDKSTTDTSINRGRAAPYSSSSSSNKTKFNGSKTTSNVVKNTTNVTAGTSFMSGGGGRVPPVGPPNPGFGPNLGGNFVPSSAAMVGNILPALPVAPNVLQPHGHEHWHPGMALAFGAGLAIEHMLGKRADRTISTEMRQRTDQLKEIIQTASMSTQAEHARLDAQISQQRAQLEGAIINPGLQQEQQSTTAGHEVWTGAPAATLNRVPTSGRTQESARYTATSEGQLANRQSANNAAERTAQLGANQAKETVSPRVAELIDAYQPGAPVEYGAPDTSLYAEANVRPNMVMEKVAQAAEHDVPVEIAYERRQEVRDEPGGGDSGQSGGGANAIGSILTNHHQPAAATARQLAETQAALSMNRSAQSPSYTSAAKTGFMGAVVIIVLGLIAYLVFG